MAPRNTLNAASNPTLRVACASCGEATSTDVSNDPAQRSTWNLTREIDGRRETVAVCAKCFESGWRPEGFRG